MPGLFITGTDTGVGKTLVSCALLHAYASRNFRASGMKPVSAGGGATNSDILALHYASNASAPLNLICPYPLQAPIAPHIAARQEGITINLPVILQAYRQLERCAEVIIVEGVGGFMVPLNELEDGADLATMLQLPVVLVVGLRLGCLNHALLTAATITQRGLKLAAWVANQIQPAMPAVEENIAALQQRIRAPLLGVLPFVERPDARRFAKLLALDELGFHH